MASSEHEKFDFRVRVFALLIVLGSIALIVYKFAIRAPVTKPQVTDAIAAPKPFGQMEESTCRLAGGTWNPCGSACRGSDGPCIQMCMPQCECKGAGECPAGYACMEVVNGTGICKK